MLSFLAFGTFHSNVAGPRRIPAGDWPDNIELLYYAFHVMAGLGTLMIAVMAGGDCARPARAVAPRTAGCSGS